MLEYIKGVITSLTPAYAVVEAAGLGYMVNTTVNTFTQLSSQKGEVKLLLHEVIREDARTLYGFSSEAEREMFRLLIGVSGVGPTLAILILSGISVPDLEAIILSGDHKLLKVVKGIGTKTAQRIIVDLKDKVKPSGDGAGAALLPGLAAPRSEAYEEALAAMVALGFAKPQSTKVLGRLFDADPSLRAEQAVKKALPLM